MSKSRQNNIRPFCSNVKWLLFSFLLLQINYTYSQTGNENALLKDARSAYMNGNYQLAIENYQQLIKLNESSADYYFELGLSIWSSEINKEKSLDYFEMAMALDTKKAIKEITYYAGQAAHYSGDFQKAIKYYDLFSDLIDPKSGAELKKFVEHEIKMCQLAPEIMNREIDSLKAESMGEKINSVYSEYAPVLKNDGTALLFTARTSNTTNGKKAGDARFYEDIYITFNKNGEWEDPSKIDSALGFSANQFNSSRHNAAVAFNTDQTILYLYKDADLYESHFETGKWNDPVKMSAKLNTRELEPSLFISPDEKYLLLVSARKGGMGGRDIYMLEKNGEGEWNDAINLGDKINTPFDEDAPFISSDGNILYFSSKGHNAIGGYDIFKSAKDDNGNWGEPVNMGVPINSTGDDIYFIQSKEGKSVYFSSNRIGSLGGMDLYTIREREVTDTNAILVQNNISPENSMKDSAVAINQNSVLNDLTEKPENDSSETVKNSQQDTDLPQFAPLDMYFEQYFGYNEVPEAESNASFYDFMNKLKGLFNQKPVVEIFVEASASRVPTSSFTSNEELANRRADECKLLLEKSLASLGVAKERYEVIISAKVQGPDYNDDYDTNAAVYGKYQYVRIRIQ